MKIRAKTWEKMGILIEKIKTLGIKPELQQRNNKFI